MKTIISNEFISTNTQNLMALCHENGLSVVVNKENTLAIYGEENALVERVFNPLIGEETYEPSPEAIETFADEVKEFIAEGSVLILNCYDIEPNTQYIITKKGFRVYRNVNTEALKLFSAEC